MFVAVYTGACQDANQGVSTTLKELIIMPLVNTLFLTHRETVDMFNGWLAALQGEPMNNDVATGLASAFHVGIVACDALFVSIVSEEPLSAEALTEYVENYEKPEARDFSWSIFDKFKTRLTLTSVTLPSISAHMRLSRVFLLIAWNARLNSMLCLLKQLSSSCSLGT